MLGFVCSCFVVVAVVAVVIVVVTAVVKKINHLVTIDKPF